MEPTMTIDETNIYATLHRAIENRNVVSFSYQENSEKKPITIMVEPYLIGVEKETNVFTLKAWDLEEMTRDEWKCYFLKNISNIIIKEKVFTGERLRYNRNDDSFYAIISHI